MDETAEPVVLEGKPAMLRATIQVTRAATGKVETFELVGTEIQEDKPCQ